MTQSTPLEHQGDTMTNDLWRVLILLVMAVWLAAHDHRLRDNEPAISEAPSNETATASRH
jgi:hypothetical protein